MKKPFQIFEHLGIDPALDFLAGPLHLNQACLAKLFDVVRHCGGDDLQIFGYITHTGTLLSFKTPDGTGHATGHKAKKDLQPVWIRKGLEYL